MTRLAGQTILLALGAAAAILFALAVAHIPWSRASVAIVAAICVVATVLAPHPPLRGTFSPPRGAKDLIGVALLVLAGVLLVGYAMYATLAPPWEADFLANWGVKARTFWEARTIDWNYLQIERSVHPDYPPLLPLLFDFVAVVRGAWNDAAFGLINAAFALGLLLIIHGVALEESGSRFTAAFVMAASVPLAATPWIGIGDGPFIAYATSGLLLMRRHMTAASVMLGLSAFTKNEGLALIVAAAIALIVARRLRDVVRLWPAVVIAVPWLICRLAFHLQSDIAAGGLLTRILERVRDPQAIATAFISAPFGRPLFLVSLLLGLAIAWRQVDRFVLLAVAIQFAFYVAVYLATPHDIGWHVRWSWERLIAHLTPSIAVAILIANMRTVSPRGAEPSSSVLPDERSPRPETARAPANQEPQKSY